MADPTDNPTPLSEDEDSSRQATLAEREAFKPSAETQRGGQSDGKPNGKKAKADKPEPTTAMGKLWHGWVKPIGSVIIVVVVVRSMLIDWNDVPSGSMEPEIHVGDRVAVNRLAYALQFPLTGPTLGIPFIGPQFDNPLDGIPQVPWGTPERGDIVTFWNPVTDIRMIKRIVAVPGDTIELRNSRLIINGTEATYEGVDAAAAGLPVQSKTMVPNPLGGQKPDYDTVTYRRESLLGEERLTQHIEDNWVDNIHIIEVPGGGFQIVRDGIVKYPQPGGTTAEQPVDDFLRDVPRASLLAQINDGRIMMGGSEASYNDFAEALLKRFAAGPIAQALDKMGLGVKGSDLTVDGEAVFNETFRVALDRRKDRLSQSDRAMLGPFLEAYGLLRNLLATNFGPYTVPERGYLMIGDNRNNSSDGRFFGPVDRGEITGQAFAVAFSFEDNKMFALPPDPAWNRFFKDLE